MTSNLVCPRCGEGWHLHASSLGSCPRQQGFSLLGVTPTNPRSQESKNVLEMSGLLERVALRNLSLKGYEVYSDPPFIEVGGPAPYRGKPDGIISGAGLVLPVVIDCKALNPMAYNYWRKEGTRQRYPQYQTQIMAYLHAFLTQRYFYPDGSPIVVDPNRIGLAGLCRGSGKFYLEFVDLTDEDWEDFHDRLIAVSDVLTFGLNGVVPDRGHPHSAWQCRGEYCQWADLCWGK